MNYPDDNFNLRGLVIYPLAFDKLVDDFSQSPSFNKVPIEYCMGGNTVIHILYNQGIVFIDSKWYIHVSPHTFNREEFYQVWKVIIQDVNKNILDGMKLLNEKLAEEGYTPQWMAKEGKWQKI